MTATCICGAVKVAVDIKPDFIHDCNCSLCRKAGAAWGYFTLAQVETQGDTTAFVRHDKPNAAVEVHSCKTCGATTHFKLTESYVANNPSADQMGVNMRLFSSDALEGIEVRFPNGREWQGQGPFDYRSSSRTIGDDLAW